MMNTMVSFGMAGLAAAVPLSGRQVPHYPPTSVSTGFRLVANVTDPSKDLTPPINHWVLSGVHTGAGTSDAVLRADGGRIFYQNGTAEEIRYRRGQIQTTGGTPPFPFGLYVGGEGGAGAEAAALQAVEVNVGSGTAGVQLEHFPAVYPTLGGLSQGTYAACDQEVPYYPGQKFTTVRFVADAIDPETSLPVPQVPSGCVAIRLVAECAALPELPAGSQASYEFANSVNCYDDVAAINWSAYGP